MGRGTAAGAPAAFAAVPILFLVIFLIYPLARILALGFGPVAQSGLRAIGQAARDTDLGRLLLASAGQALLSTLLTLAAGLPVAWIFATYRFPGKELLRALLMIPFVLPTVVVGSGFASLLGSGGLLEKLAGLLTGSPGMHLSIMRTLPAVLLAHVFYNVSIVVRIVGGAWSAIDPRLGEAARVLGAGRRASFGRVTLRLLLPSLAASAMLVFAFCFSSFGVILILGGPRISTLETEIYRQAIYMFDLPAAALLSVVQLVVTAAAMFAYSRLQARSSAIQNLKPLAVTTRPPRNAAQWLLVALCGLIPTMCLLVPMGALILGSFLTRPNGDGVLEGFVRHDGAFAFLDFTRPGSDQLPGFRVRGGAPGARTRSTCRVSPGAAAGAARWHERGRPFRPGCAVPSPPGYIGGLTGFRLHRGIQ